MGVQQESRRTNKYFGGASWTKFVFKSTQRNNILPPSQIKIPACLPRMFQIKSSIYTPVQEKLLLGFFLLGDEQHCSFFKRNATHPKKYLKCSFLLSRRDSLFEREVIVFVLASAKFRSFLSLNKSNCVGIYIKMRAQNLLNGDDNFCGGC